MAILIEKNNIIIDSTSSYLPGAEFFCGRHRSLGVGLNTQNHINYYNHTYKNRSIDCAMCAQGLWGFMKIVDTYINLTGRQCVNYS